MTNPKPVFIAAIGLGGVGKSFLAQLQHIQSTLSQKTPPIDLRLILARRSKKQIHSEDWSNIDIGTVTKQLEETNQPFPPFDELLHYLSTAPGKVVLVDNTSDQKLANSYPTILKKGISIVTASKKPFSSPYALWSDIFSAAANGTATASSPSNGYLFHEASCGAALPILSTLHDLLDTGDEIQKIEGVFSGTMSFLFNNFMPVGGEGGGGGKFAAEVKKAKELGYTEPDPRDDLTGLDVARKLMILARIAGIKLEAPTSFSVESLIPKELESCRSAEEFMEKLPQFDGRMEELKASAAKEGKVVRFVGSINVPSQKVKVGLEKFDLSHPIAALKGSDNIVSFQTKRYPNPLVIQGAGAGGDVTAMGVAADLLRVIRLLH